MILKGIWNLKTEDRGLEMRLEQDDRILFLGGPNTQAGGSVNDFSDMGKGFAMITAAALDAKFPDMHLKFFNEAHPKASSQTIMESIDSICEEIQPSIVVIFIGQQDSFIAEQQHEQASIREYSRFNRVLRQTINEIQERFTRRIILLEPFLLNVNATCVALRPDLNQKIQITREVAQENHCEFVSLDGIMNELAIKNGVEAYVAKDGTTYHPATHYIIAHRLLRQFRF